MGVVLDSTVLMEGERRGLSVVAMLEWIDSKLGDDEIAIAAMTAAELVHGVWWATRPDIRARREEFVEEAFVRIPVRSMSLRIARIVGQIDAKARMKGTTIPTADLLIGATALDMGFSVATANLRHFRLIPNLRVRTLK